MIKMLKNNSIFIKISEKVIICKTVIGSISLFSHVIQTIAEIRLHSYSNYMYRMCQIRFRPFMVGITLKINI